MRKYLNGLTAYRIQMLDLDHRLFSVNNSNRRTEVLPYESKTHAFLDLTQKIKHHNLTCKELKGVLWHIL